MHSFNKKQKTKNKKEMGALTAKPYAFTARAWENNSFELFDVLNGFCSNIIIETRGLSVMRILPKHSKNFSSWLPDRIRVIYDSLNYNKVRLPYLRNGKNYYSVSWNSLMSINIFINLFILYKNMVNSNALFDINFNNFVVKKLTVGLLRNFGYIVFKSFFKKRFYINYSKFR